MWSILLGSAYTEGGRWLDFSLDRHRYTVRDVQPLNNLHLLWSKPPLSVVIPIHSWFSVYGQTFLYPFFRHNLVSIPITMVQVQSAELGEITGFGVDATKGFFQSIVFLSMLQLASYSIPSGCQIFSSRYSVRCFPVARSRMSPSNSVFTLFIIKARHGWLFNFQMRDTSTQSSSIVKKEAAPLKGVL